VSHHLISCQKPISTRQLIKWRTHSSLVSAKTTVLCLQYLL